MSNQGNAGIDELLLGSATPRELASAERTLSEDEARELEATRVALSVLATMEVTPEDPGHALRARVLASTSRTMRFGAYADRVARIFDISVGEAEAVLGTLDDPGAWVPGFVDGMQILPVSTGPRCANSLAGFAKFRPGVHFPNHAHVGDEITFVLQGGFRDNDGREYWRGEELYKPAGSEHDYEVLSGEECIAAALVLGGIEIRG